MLTPPCLIIPLCTGKKQEVWQAQHFQLSTRSLLSGLKRMRLRGGRFLHVAPLSTQNKPTKCQERWHFSPNFPWQTEKHKNVKILRHYTLFFFCWCPTLSISISLSFSLSLLSLSSTSSRPLNPSLGQSHYKMTSVSYPVFSKWSPMV